MKKRRSSTPEEWQQFQEKLLERFYAAMRAGRGAVFHIEISHEAQCPLPSAGGVLDCACEIDSIDDVREIVPDDVRRKRRAGA
jgi:hypothetical protein